MQDDSTQDLMSQHDTNEAQSSLESSRLKSGVYIITNTETGDCYIGSAVKIEKRLTQHRHMLRLGQHHSTPLQEAWNHYGEDAFTFDVLEVVADPSLLTEVEQHYLDQRQPQYNRAKIALRNGAGVVSDPEKLRRKREVAQRRRLDLYAFYDEVADELGKLRATVKRDDDVMKVLSVAQSLSSRERRVIEESADLATLLYKEGLTSGKQYVKVMEALSHNRSFDTQVLIGEWTLRGISPVEIITLTNRLYSLVIGDDATSETPTMTRTEIALISLASSVARDLHERNDSRGFDAITGDVDVAGRIVGDTRRQIEAATGQPVVSPRNMLRAPDGGLWAQLPAAEPDQEDE